LQLVVVKSISEASRRPFCSEEGGDEVSHRQEVMREERLTRSGMMHDQQGGIACRMVLPSQGETVTKRASTYLTGGRAYFWTSLII
jgi:hypothetical protein